MFQTHDGLVVVMAGVNHTVRKYYLLILLNLLFMGAMADVSLGHVAGVRELSSSSSVWRQQQRFLQGEVLTNDFTVEDSLNEPPCGGCPFEISLLTDTLATETRWTLEKCDTTNGCQEDLSDDNFLVAEGYYFDFNQSYKRTVCLPAPGFYNFTLADDFGDGINAPGGYNVSICNGNITHTGPTGDFTADTLIFAVNDTSSGLVPTATVTSSPTPTPTLVPTVISLTESPNLDDNTEAPTPEPTMTPSQAVVIATNPETTSSPTTGESTNAPSSPTLSQPKGCVDPNQAVQFAQCPCWFEINVQTDNVGDTSWELLMNEKDGRDFVVSSGGGFGANEFHHKCVCLQEDGDYVFVIYDSQGNGLQSPGGYLISLEGRCGDFEKEGGRFNSISERTAFSVALMDDPPPPSSPSLSLGAIIGIACAGCFLFVGMLAGVYYWGRKSSSEEKHQRFENASIPTEVTPNRSPIHETAGQRFSSNVSQMSSYGASAQQGVPISTTGGTTFPPFDPSFQGSINEHIPPVSSSQGSGSHISQQRQLSATQDNSNNLGSSGDMRESYGTGDGIEQPARDFVMGPPENIRVIHDLDDASELTPDIVYYRPAFRQQQQAPPAIMESDPLENEQVSNNEIPNMEPGATLHDESLESASLAQ